MLPVGKVDQTFDQLPDGFESHQLNAVAKGAYRHYDAVKMHGLPIGVQVVGRRLEEEQVLGYMSLLVDALAESGYVFEQSNA